MRLADFVGETVAMTPFGKYDLQRRIAKGGMAEIFLASQRGPAGFEKQLIIKRILPQMVQDNAFITMFLDEARLAARLAHPNIVQIYELGEEAGAYYIAMEYVRGPSLSTVIRKLRDHGLQLPLHYAAWIIAKVAAGLDYAHSLVGDDGQTLGLVHRDISPDNVLVTEQGAVKMIDFGVAKARTNETKTVAGTVKGKLRYMSPEQVQGKPLDGRSDLFSLGIVLHELTTLRRPFGGSSELAAVSAIISEPPERPSAVIEGYPTALEGIITKALEKDREQRYASGREMQTDLETFVHSRGTYLTEREVGAYLARLFSADEDDIAALKAIPSGVHTAAAGSIGSAAFVPTQINTSAVRLEEDVEPPRSGGGGRVLALVGLLLVAAAVGAALWFLVFSKEGEAEATADTPPAVASASDVGQAAGASVDAGPPPQRRGQAGTVVGRHGIESDRDDTSSPRPALITPSARHAIETDTQARAVVDDVVGPGVASAPDVITAAAVNKDVSAQPEVVVALTKDVASAPDITTASTKDVAPAPGITVVSAEDVASEPDTGAVVARDVAAPVAVPEFGVIRVRGPIGSKVFIDGRSYGSRVNTGIRVKAGYHRVLLNPPRGGAPRHVNVRVKPGGRRTVIPR